MKKIFVSVVVVMIFLMTFGVVAESAVSDNESGLSVEEKVAVKTQLNEITEPALAGDVQKYVEEFVEKRGIGVEQINNVSEVNFDDLPKEVNIENVNDANLAIYQVDYQEEAEEKQMFVVTYSVEELRAQGDLIIAHDKRQFLNFGSVGEMSGAGFLNTATGVEGSLEAGYVMMREGSITGISTSLDVVNSSSGKIEIIIYKNGEAIIFGNTIDSSSEGVKKDYDVQSRDTVTFEPGDVISAYVNTEGEAVWKSVITMVEITTIN